MKKRLMLKSYTTKILPNSKLEIGIDKVLRKIELTPMDELEPLNYDAVGVRDKILKENVLLLRTIINNVTDYYIFLKNLFTQLDK